MKENLIPAAQYLRMSTEEQEYSLDNQADAIQRYAELNRFEVIRTYVDAGRSGVTLNNRNGLKQLLLDVATPGAPFRAVLVYDVSRWGRFQDLDEAAHYEFICKSSGAPVHYAAETFKNTGGMPDLIMKALKRTMAGEYSRELSVKVNAGIRRNMAMGFSPGARAVYGLRRQLVSSDGRPKRLLKLGEMKYVRNEHVQTVLGPRFEQDVIRRIFREFVEEDRMPQPIADGLNRDGIRSVTGRDWGNDNVLGVLTQTKYIGVRKWGVYTRSLSTPCKLAPPENVVTAKLSFGPIVSEELFQRAQAKISNFASRLSDEQMLDKLRDVLRENGRITGTLVDESRLCPSIHAYKARFGSFREVCYRLGMKPFQRLDSTWERARRLRRMRDEVVRELKQLFPKLIDVFQKDPHARPRVTLKKPKTLRLTVAIAKFMEFKTGGRWYIILPEEERGNPALIAFLNQKTDTIRALWVFSDTLQITSVCQVERPNGPLAKGERLHTLEDLFLVLNRVLTDGTGSGSLMRRHDPAGRR